MAVGRYTFPLYLICMPGSGRKNERRNWGSLRYHYPPLCLSFLFPSLFCHCSSQIETRRRTDGMSECSKANHSFKNEAGRLLLIELILLPVSCVVSEWVSESSVWPVLVAFSSLFYTSRSARLTGTISWRHSGTVPPFVSRPLLIGSHLPLCVCVCVCVCARVPADYLSVVLNGCYHLFTLNTFLISL
jgi:hypothetical protein